MKFELIIDPNSEEKVTVVAKSKNDLVEKIEELVTQTSGELVGFWGKEGEKISPNDVCFFMVEEDKIYAEMVDKKLQIKSRLYILAIFY